jgi:hypothetical protein
MTALSADEIAYRIGVEARRSARAFDGAGRHGGRPRLPPQPMRASGT